MQKRFAIYARCATVQELGANFAMSEQVRQCKEYGEQKEYTLECIYEEVGSGSTVDRPVLKEVLISAEERKFDALIIRSFDRIARNSDLIQVVITTLEGYGVKVMSATQDVEMERLTAVIREEIARIERERISARSRAGRQRKGK